MEELKVYVREKPTEKYDWNTRTVQFENGKNNINKRGLHQKLLVRLQQLD